MSNSLAGQTILVTGGCGYLGTQLIRDLAQIDNIKIRILDNFQRHNQQALMGLPEHCCYEFIEGDILDPVVQRIALKGVHTIIHLAALVSTPISFTDPVWLQQVNHWGTVQLGEAALKAEVQHFIYASSTAVYGPVHSMELQLPPNATNITGTKAFNENTSCQPIGPYAQSKLDAENGLRQLQNRGLDLTILRFGSIYGLGSSMRFDSVVNKFCYLAGIKRAITLYGDGQQKRPVIHISDASAAVMFMISKEPNAHQNTYNVVAENPKIMDLYSILSKEIADLPIRYTEQDVLNHLSFFVSGELLSKQGFKTNYSLQKGIKEMLDAFSNFSPIALA